MISDVSKFSIFFWVNYSYTVTLKTVLECYTNYSVEIHLNILMLIKLYSILSMFIGWHIRD